MGELQKQVYHISINTSEDLCCSICYQKFVMARFLFRNLNLQIKD